MFCANCGNEIKNDSKFCDKCGTLQCKEDVLPVQIKQTRGLFSGRIGRMRFFLGNILGFSLLCIPVTLWGLVNVLNKTAGSGGGYDGLFYIFGRLIPILILISLIFAIFLSIALSIRRLHDFGYSGLWILVCYIPYIGIIPALFILFAKGDVGDNRFGPSPLKNKKFIEDIFNR